jgi:Ni,Fe-hydrogenase III component G
LANKSARENSALMAEKKAEVAVEKLKKEKEQIEIAVSEKVKDAVVETVAPITVDTNASVSVIIETKEEVSNENTVPDFTKMTKKEIDIWADENLGIQLDRRNTKDRMIADLKPHL